MTAELEKLIGVKDETPPDLTDWMAAVDAELPDQRGLILSLDKRVEKLGEEVARLAALAGGEAF